MSPSIKLVINIIAVLVVDGETPGIKQLPLIREEERLDVVHLFGLVNLKEVPELS